MERIEKMSLRTIMIFPEFDNIDIIDEIRAKYDPLAKLVRPHITIVFPFEMDICFIVKNLVHLIWGYRISHI